MTNCSWCNGNHNIENCPSVIGAFGYTDTNDDGMCEIPGCNNTANRGRWCKGHYMQAVRRGEYIAPKCANEYCNSLAIPDDNLCGKHATMRDNHEIHQRPEGQNDIFLPKIIESPNDDFVRGGRIRGYQETLKMGYFPDGTVIEIRGERKIINNGDTE
jgi:hypothetical protein